MGRIRAAPYFIYRTGASRLKVFYQVSGKCFSLCKNLETNFLSSLYMDFFLNHSQRYTWTEVFHYNLTLLRSTEKMCTRAGFQLAPSGYRSGALLVELLSSQALEVSFYPTLLHEIFSRQLNAYPWEDVQCFMENGTLWRAFFQKGSVFPFVSNFTFTVSNHIFLDTNHICNLTAFLSCNLTTPSKKVTTLSKRVRIRKLMRNFWIRGHHWGKVMKVRKK